LRQLVEEKLIVWTEEDTKIICASDDEDKFLLLSGFFDDFGGSHEVLRLATAYDDVPFLERKRKNGTLYWNAEMTLNEIDPHLNRHHCEEFFLFCLDDVCSYTPNELHRIGSVAFSHGYVKVLERVESLGLDLFSIVPTDDSFRTDTSYPLNFTSSLKALEFLFDRFTEDPKRLRLLYVAIFEDFPSFVEKFPKDKLFFEPKHFEILKMSPEYIIEFLNGVPKFVEAWETLENFGIDYFWEQVENIQAQFQMQIVEGSENIFRYKRRNESGTFSVKMPYVVSKLVRHFLLSA
jgi:hypothetical protein